MEANKIMINLLPSMACLLGPNRVRFTAVYIIYYAMPRRSPKPKPPARGGLRVGRARDEVELSSKSDQVAALDVEYSLGPRLIAFLGIF